MQHSSETVVPCNASRSGTMRHMGFLFSCDATLCTACVKAKLVGCKLDNLTCLQSVPVETIVQMGEKADSTGSCYVAIACHALLQC